MTDAEVKLLDVHRLMILGAIIVALIIVIIMITAKYDQLAQLYNKNCAADPYLVQIPVNFTFNFT